MLFRSIYTRKGRGKHAKLYLHIAPEPCASVELDHRVVVDVVGGEIMPRCAVLQPNGYIAEWSTIVDNFTELQNTREEYTASHKNYGAVELHNIDESGVSWDWAPDWSECIRTLKEHGEMDMLTEINNIGLSHNIKRFSRLKYWRYWCNYWRAKCQNLEADNNSLKYLLRTK